MKKQHGLVFISLCLFLFVVVMTATTSLAATRMPSFSLENVRDGKMVKSSHFKGKVLLLTFFATWCPPCVEEVPTLNRLQSELGTKGFSVVGLSVDQQGTALVADFVEQKAITYPVLMAKDKTARAFGGVYGIPVAFLVNKSGNVVKRYSGYVQHRTLEKDIRSLL